VAKNNYSFEKHQKEIAKKKKKEAKRLQKAGVGDSTREDAQSTSYDHRSVTTGDI
jgi:hypothetical protein